MKVIKIRLNCCGESGCKKMVDMDYAIAERSYNLMMNDDIHFENSTLMGVRCVNCGNNYAFIPSRLKTMII